LGVADHKDATARASGGVNVVDVWEMLLENLTKGDAEVTDLCTLAEILLGDSLLKSC